MALDRTGEEREQEDRDKSRRVNDTENKMGAWITWMCSFIWDLCGGDWGEETDPWVLLKMCKTD